MRAMWNRGGHETEGGAMCAFKKLCVFLTAAGGVCLASSVASGAVWFILKITTFVCQF